MQQPICGHESEATHEAACESVGVPSCILVYRLDLKIVSLQNHTFSSYMIFSLVAGIGACLSHSNSLDYGPVIFCAGIWKLQQLKYYKARNDQISIETGSGQLGHILSGVIWVIKKIIRV